MVNTHVDVRVSRVKDYNLLYFFPSHRLTSIQFGDELRLAEAVIRAVTILRRKTIVTQ